MDTYCCWLALPEAGCWITAQGYVCRLCGDLNNGLATQFQWRKCALEVSCTWDVLYKSTSLPFFTFPARKHHCPVADTKLYCLVTGICVWTICPESVTWQRTGHGQESKSNSQVYWPNRYIAKPHWSIGVMLLIMKCFVFQEWQLLEGTILQLVSELFLKLKQEKTDTSTHEWHFYIS